jgi:hypothetical protein
MREDVSLSRPCPLPSDLYSAFIRSSGLRTEKVTASSLFPSRRLKLPFVRVFDVVRFQSPHEVGSVSSLLSYLFAILRDGTVGSITTSLACYKALEGRGAKLDDERERREEPDLSRASTAPPAPGWRLPKDPEERRGTLSRPARASLLRALQATGRDACPRRRSPRASLG